MKLVKIIKAIFALLIVLGFYMIMTKSFYGVVDENGNKITNMQEILEMEQEQENKIVQNEEIVKEEEKTEDVSVSASKENIQKKNTKESQVNTQTNKKETTTEKQTMVQEKQIEKPKQEEKVETKQEEIKQEEPKQVVEEKQETEEKVVEEQKCTDSKHKVSAGNSGKWFNSYDEAVAYYDNLINSYSNQIHNGQITIEEYNKQCPYGYEIWSCPYCHKWTLNYYYR